MQIPCWGVFIPLEWSNNNDLANQRTKKTWHIKFNNVLNFSEPRLEQNCTRWLDLNLAPPLCVYGLCQSQTQTKINKIILIGIFMKDSFEKLQSSDINFLEILKYTFNWLKPHWIDLKSALRTWNSKKLSALRPNFIKTLHESLELLYFGEKCVSWSWNVSGLLLIYFKIWYFWDQIQKIQEYYWTICRIWATWET